MDCQAGDSRRTPHRTSPRGSAVFRLCATTERSFRTLCCFLLLPLYYISCYMSHTELIRECGALPKPTKAQCRCEHNWGLVRFLKALAQQESGKGKDQWCMVLRRAAKGLAAHEARVTSSERAIKEVLNVGRSGAPPAVLAALSLPAPARCLPLTLLREASKRVPSSSTGLLSAVLRGAVFLAD